MRWAENDWPLIVRRQDAEMPMDMVALGLPLPPDLASGKKGRISFSAHRTEIMRSEPAIDVHEVRSALPVRWHHAHADLCRQFNAAQLELRVYGSLAMQASTGLPYLGEQSDIDLLFSPRNHRELKQGLALLADYAQRLPLDGEIVFPSERAVAWKEWLQVNQSSDNVYVLTKSMSSVALIRADELLAELSNELPNESPNELTGELPDEQQEQG
jgi:phosphoribosyl-dephospho-CoA transferase